MTNTNETGATETTKHSYEKSMRALRDTRVDRNIANAVSDYIRNNFMGQSALAASVGVSGLAAVIREQLIAEMVDGKLELL